MHTALVLEGGGMRGIYTAGVLDYLLEQGYFPDVCYGVSAGACHAVSYLAKQKERAYRVVAEYCQDSRYMSWRNVLSKGSLFGMEMMFDTIPNQLYPFAYDDYKENPTKMLAVITNCISGEASYQEIYDLAKDTLVLQASMSLPLLAQEVVIDGIPYLDGGISDSIPVIEALKACANAIVVCTQSSDYRKKKNALLPLIQVRYRKFPMLIEALRLRHERYNETLEQIVELEKSKRIFVIRPRAPLQVGRLERNPQVLQKLYEQGYQDASAAWSDVCAFLQDIKVQG